MKDYIFSVKEEDRQFINCYFVCKIKEGHKEFIGLNNEKIKWDFCDIENLVFERDKIYYFEKLLKKDKFLSFIKNISSYTKSDGVILNSNIETFNTSEPYSLTGKIIKKEKEQIFFLISAMNEIIVLTDIKNQFDNINENQYITISFIRFSFKKDGIIYFKLNDFSLITVLDKDYQENAINEKVAIQFNLLDYSGFQDQNDIMIKQFGIETPQKQTIIFSPDRKFIFYVYNANGYEQEYFAQNLYLYFTDENIPFNLKFFVYKSLLNEVNLFIRQKYLFAYEFLYFSLDDSLPKDIEIYYQPKKKFKSTDFHTFNSKLRKSIIFINIPIQNNGDNKFDNSFLSIYLCSKTQINLYGTFCLESIGILDKKFYQFNQIIENNIINIYKDYTDCFELNGDPIKFNTKYFSFGSDINTNIQNELNEKFHLFKYQNTKHTLEYFNSLCLWNLFYVLINIKQSFGYVEEYVKVYRKIEDRKDLNYIDKSMILIDFVLRSFEDKSNFICPKLFFYDELDKNNPYKIAYNFQYDIIENITEESCLFQPFLFLDSYIMNSIQKKGSFDFIKVLKPAYSISMLTIELIKEHLKKTIKNYFFVLGKQGVNNRRYYASVNKFTKLITYNENILLYNSNYKKMYELSKTDIIFESKIFKNYAFIVNLENLHENFSHSKELILNNQASPTLYFNRNLDFSYVYHYNSQDYGEAGRLMEAFICGENLIEEMKKNIYEMGEFLKVEYYVGKDFQSLINGFKKIYKNYHFGEKKKLKFIDIKSSNDYHYSYENEPKNLSGNDDKLEKEKSLFNTKEMENSIDNKDEEIILSKHNTYILSAETYEKLLEKIEKMKTKKIIVRDDAIEDNNDICCY